MERRWRDQPRFARGSRIAGGTVNREHFYALMGGEGTLDYELYLNTKTLLSCQSKFADFCNKDEDRKSTRLNSRHVEISYAVFCLKKKKKNKKNTTLAQYCMTL